MSETTSERSYMHLRFPCVAAALLMVSTGVYAQQADAPLPPPELPESMQEGEVIEPEVTIIQRDEQRVEEFRVNGRMYMVRISPEGAPAYYMIDNDGDGHLESFKHGVEDLPAIPQWVLFSW